jgi:hypothetical protein
MHVFRRTNLPGNGHPVSNVFDFAKGHSGLGHSPWPWVYANEDDFSRAHAETPEILFVRNLRVIDGQIKVRNVRAKLERREVAFEFAADGRGRSPKSCSDRTKGFTAYQGAGNLLSLTQG